MADTRPVNDILSDILGVVTQISRQSSSGKGKGGVAQANGMGADVSGALQADKKSSLAGTVSAVKDLSNIKLSSLIKLQLFNWDKLGEKISGFMNAFAEKNYTDESLKAISKVMEAFTKLATTLTELNMTKLAKNLEKFPSKTFAETIKSIIEAMGNFSEKDKQNAKAAKAMVDAIAGITTALKESTKIIIWAIPAVLGLTLAMGFLFIFKLMIGIVTLAGDPMQSLISIICVEHMIGVVKKMGNMVWTAALLGVLGVLLLPLVLVGFGIVALTLWGVMFLIKNIMTVVPMTKIGVLGMWQIRKLISTVVKLPLWIALVGFVFIKFWPYVLVGFAVITVTLFAVIGITMIVSKVTKSITGTGGFRAVNTIMTFMLKAAGIAALALLLGLAIIGIGKLLNKSASDDLLGEVGVGKNLFMGLGVYLVGMAVIALSAIAAGGLARLLIRIMKGADLTRAQNIGKRLIIFMAEAAGIAALCIVIGAIIMAREDGWKEGLIGLGALVGVVTVCGVLVKILSKMSKSEVNKGSIILGVIAGVMIALGLAVMEFAKASEILTKSGNTWWSILAGLGVAALAVAAMGALLFAAAALSLNPLFSAGMTMGCVVMGVISGVMIALGLAMIEFATANEKINKIGGEAAVKTGFAAMSNFVTMAKDMLLIIGDTSLGTILKARLVMKPLREMVGMLSTFVETVAKFGGEEGPGKFRLVTGYDKQGKPIYGDPVDIKKVSEAIGIGFGTFAQELMKKVKDIKVDIWAGTIAKQLGKLIDPVQKFIKIVAEQQWSEDGKMKLFEYDKDGKKTGNTYDIDLEAIGRNIGTGFATFAANVLNGIKDAVDYCGFFSNTGEKVDLIAKVMDPVTKFVDTIVKMNKDLNGVDINAIARKLTTGMKTFLSTGFNYNDAALKLFLKNGDAYQRVATYFDNAMQKIEKHNKKLLKETTDGEVEFMEKISASIDKNIKTIERYNKALDKMYKNQTELYRCISNWARIPRGKPCTLQFNYNVGPASGATTGTVGSVVAPPAPDSTPAVVNAGIQGQDTISDGGLISGRIIKKNSGTTPDTVYKVKLAIDWNAASFQHKGDRYANINYNTIAEGSGKTIDWDSVGKKSDGTYMTKEEYEQYLHTTNEFGTYGSDANYNNFS